jgi:PAS domain S-box-containing protein
MAATDIGTLFLDKELRIKLFTPPTAKHFNITHADLGRVITDFTHRLKYDNLESDAKKVLESLVPMETEVRTLNDRWLMMRMRPYRTVENVVDGVVVTLADVTELKRTEESLAVELNAMARLQELSIKDVESVELEPSLISILDAIMELLGADFGNIQLYDSGTGKLRLVALRGFDERYRNRLAEVDGSEASTCARALAIRQQILIEDVDKESGFQEDLEWAAAAGFRAIQSTPLVTGNGKLVGMLSTHFREPRRFSTLDLRLIDICARQASDAINAHLLQDSLRKSEIRLRQVLETETVDVLFLDADGVIIDANKAFLRMTGYSRAEVDARELSWRKMTPPEWVALTQEQFDELPKSGLIGPYEKEYVRKDGSRCWMLFAGRKLNDDTIAEYCIDISKRKRAELERELLAAELSHRVKNTLAVVEAPALQTTAKSVKEFRGKFSGRIQALAQAHTLLFESDWSSVDLEVLLEQGLSAYHIDHARRVQTDGAAIAVTPKQALGLRLVVHELATNAVKYGALSTKRGIVHLSWQIEETGDRQHQVRLRWMERGGPTIEAPQQCGFGAKLIKTVCEYDLDGEARLDYAREGLICEIVFPTT